MRTGDDNEGNKIRRGGQDERRLGTKGDGDGNKLPWALFRCTRHDNSVCVGHVKLDFVVCNAPSSLCADEGADNVMCVRATCLEFAVIALISYTSYTRTLRHCKRRLLHTKSFRSSLSSNRYAKRRGSPCRGEWEKEKPCRVCKSAPPANAITTLVPERTNASAGMHIGLKTSKASSKVPFSTPVEECITVPAKSATLEEARGFLRSINNKVRSGRRRQWRAWLLSEPLSHELQRINGPKSQ